MHNYCYYMTWLVLMIKIVWWSSIRDVVHAVIVVKIEVASFSWACNDYDNNVCFY